VGGTTVVKKIELFEKKGFEASFGGVVGGGASHDAGADNNDIIIGTGRVHRV